MNVCNVFGCMHMEWDKRKRKKNNNNDGDNDRDRDGWAYSPHTHTHNTVHLHHIAIATNDTISLAAATGNGSGNGIISVWKTYKSWMHFKRTPTIVVFAIFAISKQQHPKKKKKKEWTVLISWMLQYLLLHDSMMNSFQMKLRWEECA